MLSAELVDERYEFMDLTGRKLEALILDCDAAAVKVERISDRRCFEIPLEDLSQADRAYLTRRYRSEPENEDSLLILGVTLVLNFPELGEMAGGKAAQCELSVPKNYDARHPVPLLVWFSGEKGSLEVPKAGHGLNGAGRELIREWIEATFAESLI